MEQLLDRFCRYVKVNTQAGDPSHYPSSPGQLTLGKILLDELRAIGVTDAEQDQYGLVYGTIPSTSKKDLPTIAFVAHMDTSPEASGADVKPMIHRNYTGDDIVLSADRSKVIKVSENPALQRLTGKTIITTDGTTLLGSDDKSGVAVIMEAASRLLKNQEIEHGPIRILFTCDEEIGRGVDFVDLKKLGAHVAYTLDGGGAGEIDIETFSADVATVRFIGIGIHPSIGKGRMINALRLASQFISLLPSDGYSPETTEDREGFFHPYQIEGGVPECTLRILLRDFDDQKLQEKGDTIRRVAREIEFASAGSKVEVDIRAQYRNMRLGLEKEPRAVLFARKAMERLGIAPNLTIVRGGTDGSRLTALGLPTPNLSTGEHNLHSVLEWTCLEEMELAVGVVIELAKVWCEER